MQRCILGLVAVLAPGCVTAQQADGTYPARLACDAGFGGAAIRAPVTVAISGGRAQYEFRLGAGRETGAGTFSGRTLSLSGSGRGSSGSYQARYSGEVTGRGGLLTGTHTGSSGARRACQLVLGDG